MICSQEIRRKLKVLTPRRLSKQYSGEAAVLLGIVERGGQPHLVLTRRTEDVATHKGQISFPGGMREPGDVSSSDTALRETQEELGLDPLAIEIVGEFHEYLAVTNQKVRCFVGFVSSDAGYLPHSGEVAYVLEVPVDFFIETSPSVEKQFRLGLLQNVYFYDFNGETIWGLTARIIKDFLEFLGQPAVLNLESPQRHRGTKASS